MKRATAFRTVVLIILSFLWAGQLQARPMGDYEAAMVVTGWLKADPQPLGSPMARTLSGVETVVDELGQPLYYIVSLDPSGFVIVSPDDLIEPILGFTHDGAYDALPANPLAALITNDVSRRLLAALLSGAGALPDSGTGGLALASIQEQQTDSQKKWRRYIELVDAPGRRTVDLRLGR
jgi:hypothetical protein